MDSKTIGAVMFSTSYVEMNLDLINNSTIGTGAIGGYSAYEAGVVNYYKSPISLREEKKTLHNYSFQFIPLFTPA